jgi:hypothetical protein
MNLYLLQKLLNGFITIGLELVVFPSSCLMVIHLVNGFYSYIELEI